MSWEARGKEHYYNKKLREGKMVRSMYFGKGELAEIVSQTHRLKVKLLKQRKDTTAQRQEIDRQIEEACDLVQQITNAWLLAAGFHLHKGQWRKKRYERT